MRKKATNYCIVSIGDEGAIFTRTNAKGSLLSRHFFSSARDKEYQHFMDRHEKDTIYVISDVMDQEFKREQFPPVSRINLKPLVQRKIRTDYEKDLDIIKAISLGKQMDNSNSWHYLFVNIRNQPPLSDWLNDLLPRPNPFGGIVPAPFIMAALSNRLSKKPKLKKRFAERAQEVEWQIYISLQRVGGIRQVVIHKGEVMFSRITAPVGEHKPDVIAGHMYQEATNTIEFIRRLGFEDDQGLEIITLAGGDVTNTLSHLHFSTQNVQHLTPLDASARIKIAKGVQSDDQFGDVLTALFFAKRQQKFPLFYTKDAKQKRNTQRLARSMRLVALGLVGLIVAWLAWWGYDSLKHRSKSAELKQQIASLQSIMAEKRLDISVGGYKVEQIQSIIDTQHQSKHIYTSLDRLTKEIARVGNSYGIMSEGFRMEVVPVGSKEGIKAVFSQSFPRYDVRPWEEKMQQFDAYEDEMRTALEKDRVRFNNVPTSTEIELDLNTEGLPEHKPFTFTMEVLHAFD